MKRDPKTGRFVSGGHATQAAAPNTMSLPARDITKDEHTPCGKPALKKYGERLPHGAFVCDDCLAELEDKGWKFRSDNMPVQPCSRTPFFMSMVKEAVVVEYEKDWWKLKTENPEVSDYVASEGRRAFSWFMTRFSTITLRSQGYVGKLMRKSQDS